MPLNNVKMGLTLTNNNKVALVTGASKRIGAAITEALHNEGYTIALHYFHGEVPAKLLAEKLNTTRADSCILFQADLADCESTATLIQSVISEFSAIDLLVNNASIYKEDKTGSLIEQWDTTMNTNVRASFQLSHGLKQHFNAQGSIIKLIDSLCDKPEAKHTIYSISKSALRMLTESLAVEFAPNIRVNGVSPGTIFWPEDRELDDDYKAEHGEIPLQRNGKAKDVADVVLFLARQSYVTGEIIRVDGGKRLV